MPLIQDLVRVVSFPRLASRRRVGAGKFFHTTLSFCRRRLAIRAYAGLSGWSSVRQRGPRRESRVVDYLRLNRPARALCPAADADTECAPALRAVPPAFPGVSECWWGRGRPRRCVCNGEGRTTGVYMKMSPYDLTASSWKGLQSGCSAIARAWRRSSVG